MKVTRTSSFVGLISCALLIVLLSILLWSIASNGKLSWEAGLVLGSFLLWLCHGIYRACLRIKETGSSPGDAPSSPQMMLCRNPKSIRFFLWNLVFSPAGMPLSSSLSLLLFIWIGVYAIHTSRPILIILSVCWIAGLRLWIFNSFKRLYLNMKAGNMLTLIDHRGVRWIIPGNDGGNWLEEENYCTIEKADWENISDIRFFPHYIQLCSRDIDFFAFTDNMGEARQLISRYFRNSQPVPPINQPQHMDKLISQLKRNTILFTILDSKEILVPGQSKFGGTPDVSKNFEWPLSADGSPLSFLAQINCAEIAHLDTEHLLPTSGILYFFYELSKMEWNVEGNEDSVRVLYDNPESRDQLSRATFLKSLDKKHRLPESALCFESKEIIPSWEDLHALKPRKNFNLEEYIKISEDFSIDEHPNTGRLLGYANLIQSSIISDRPNPSHAVLLFELDSTSYPDTQLMFCDFGSIYFYIDKRDLAKLDFSNIWFNLQSF